MEAVKISLPKWVSVIYGLVALILIPWIFDLAQNLPQKHLSRNWDIVWVGFDIIMLFTILLTIWFLIKRRIWVIVSATALATLFIIDVWFDILTAKPGKETREALFFGIFEITLAILTYRFVFKIIHRSTPKKDIDIKHY